MYSTRVLLTAFIIRVNHLLEEIKKIKHTNTSVYVLYRFLKVYFILLQNVHTPHHVAFTDIVFLNELKHSRGGAWPGYQVAMQRTLPRWSPPCASLPGWGLGACECAHAYEDVHVWVCTVLCACVCVGMYSVMCMCMCGYVQCYVHVHVWVCGHEWECIMYEHVCTQLPKYTCCTLNKDIHNYTYRLHNDIMG